MSALHRRFLLATLLTLTLAAPDGKAASFEDTMAQRTLACTACHGDQGRAGPDGYYPRLAGKPAGYLYNQLVNFRDGRRHYALMTGLIDPLNDAYLREIADYFSSLDLPYPKPKPTAASAAVLARGEVLAKKGDAASRIPACAQCHGTALTGVAPNMPGLLGLPLDYLNAQLGGWQTGQRHASAPDCMAQVAKKLGDADINAVAHWLSSQPVPPRSRAADKPPPKTAGAPDIACGSAPAQALKEVQAPAASPSVTVARGAYLARLGNCALCHTARGGTPYAGGRRIETPFGAVFSSNLTPHPDTGIGSWSAQDFWRALHHGESKSGRLLYPAFPYTNYTHVTRDDSDALYTYLQSLPPVNKPNTAHALRWPYSTQLALTAWRTLSFTAAPEAVSSSTDAGKTAEWNRGAYLVRGLGHCSACHSSRNALGAVDESKALAGGTVPASNWYAPSLLGQHEAGVSGWSTGDIAALMKIGIAGGGQVSGPMAEVVLNSTQYLSDADANAVAVYLKALPSLRSATPADTLPQAGRADSAGVGAKSYKKYCAECHGSQGLGEPGAYPALAGNRAVNLANPANLVQIVLSGGFAPATAGNPRPFGMPPFQLRLSDPELAAVLTYIRTAWGNTGGAVSEFDINRLRPAPTR